MARPRLLDLFCGAGGAAMDVPWMDWHGITQAIPPAYTEFIGRALLTHLSTPPHLTPRRDAAAGAAIHPDA